MPPLMGTKGAASAQGFGFTLSSLGPGSWALTGLVEVQAGIAIDRGMAVSDSGILCLMSGFLASNNNGKNVMRFFDADGLSIKNTVVESYYDGPDWGNSPKVTSIEAHVNNNNPTAPIFYPTPSANYYNPYGCGAFYHNTNTPVWSGNPWQFTNTGFNYGGPCQNVFTDSSGNLHIVPANPTLNAGKFTANQTMVAKLTSSGAFSWGYRTPGANYVGNSFQGANYGAVRTDGNIVVVGTAQGGTLGIYEMSPTGVLNNTYNFGRQSSSGGRGGVMIDSSNNIYVGTGTSGTPNYPRLFKFNSAYAPINAFEYIPGGSSSSSEDGSSWHLYSGKIYNFANRVNTTNFALTCIDAATLVPEWTLNINFSGGFNSAITIGAGNVGFKRAVTATSKGIYLGIYGNAFPTGNLISLVLKVPLTGDLTTATKIINVPDGATLTMTTSKVTSGVTMTSRSPITLNTTTGSAVSLASMAWNPRNGGTPSNFSTAATTSLTNLP
jgi:hypothetical protein